MPRKQNENLIKGVATRFKSGEEAVTKGRKGGIASGKARREKADLKKQLQLWLETEVGKDLEGNPLTGAELMVQVAAKEMNEGNAKFWELIRDTAGYKPIDKVMVADVDQAVIDEVESMVMETKPAEPKKRATRKKKE